MIVRCNESKREGGRLERGKVGIRTERKGEVEGVRNGGGAVERKERGKNPNGDEGDKGGVREH